MRGACHIGALGLALIGLGAVSMPPPKPDQDDEIIGAIKRLQAAGIDPVALADFVGPSEFVAAAAACLDAQKYLWQTTGDLVVDVAVLRESTSKIQAPTIDLNLVHQLGGREATISDADGRALAHVVLDGEEMRHTRPVLEVQRHGGARARFIETAPAPERRVLPQPEKKDRSAEQRAAQREAKRARKRTKARRGF